MATTTTTNVTKADVSEYNNVLPDTTSVEWWHIPADNLYGFILRNDEAQTIFKINFIRKQSLEHHFPEIGYRIVLREGETHKVGETPYGSFAFSKSEMIEKENLENVLAANVNAAPLESLEWKNPQMQSNQYIPESQSCASVDTIVPASMIYEMRKAMSTVHREVRNVDEYVAEKLGYVKGGKCSLEERKQGLMCLCDAFSAEQVDAIMMAIWNIEEKKQGIIIGDQTGIGKGRIAAGMIRYAIKQGLQPIFLTEKTNLFSDIFRDIIAIGSDDAIPFEFLQGYKEVEKKSAREEAVDDGDGDEVEEGFEEEETEIVRVPVYKLNKNYKSDIKGKKRLIPFIVNGRSSKTAIKDEQGNILYKGLSKQETNEIIERNRLPKEFSFVLTTYSQFRGAEETPKMEFLKRIARGTVVVMDESHNASGSSNTGKFLKEVLSGTEGVTFLSATFAKRPDNMPIYASKTAIADANLNDEELVAAITHGGVALQEILSAQLVAEGQMIRRERSFEGVEVNYIMLDSTQDLRGYPNLNLEIEHRAIADRATEIIREILEFQANYVNPYIDQLDAEAKEEYKEVEQRKGTKEAGVNNPPVFSGIFNMISQLLFSIKAEAVAEIAIQRLKEGKKPVIAFANTMESFLNTLTDDEGELVEENDVINPDFSMVLKKRLESVLRYTVIGAEGDREYLTIDVDSMDETFQFEYYRILELIKKSTIGIASSPIDVLIDRIEKAGFSVAEVTGRDRQLKFTGKGKAVIKNKVKQNATDAFRQFNNNEVDCLLINQSGSTGASAHAITTKKVSQADVKQRVMVILQPELNINTEVQKRGRINRTGQIYKPIYDYVNSAIPAEKRLTMMLQKKLKSLDANTTSNQKQSRKILDVQDFLNKYGDLVAFEYLKEHPFINKVIGDPLKIEDAKRAGDVNLEKVSYLDAAHKVSGRIAILSTKDQDEFYNEMSERYESLVQYLMQTGEYDLEVENIDLQAETISKDVVVVGKGGESYFGRNSILEKVNVNILKKPFKKVELDALLKESIGEFGDADRLKQATISKYERFIKARFDAEIEEENAHYDNVLLNVEKEKGIVKLKSAKEKTTAITNRRVEIEDGRKASIAYIQAQYKNKHEMMLRMFGFFHVGRVVGYPTLTNSQDGTYVKAVFLGFDINENQKNPYALSAVGLKFALANSDKYVNLPASKTGIVTVIRNLTLENIMKREEDYVINNWDEIIKKSSKDRGIRYIVTGNILQAFSKEELTGKLVSYTTNKGGIKKGILLPESFDPAGSKEKGVMRVTVPIIKALPIIKSMIEGRTIQTNDLFSIIRRSNDYRILVPASKKTGGKFYLNPTIIKLTEEGTFNKIAANMEASIELRKIDNLVEFLQQEFNSNVELIPQEFEKIKASIQIEDYNDEEVMRPKEEIIIERLKEEDRQIEQELEQKRFAFEQKQRDLEAKIESSKAKDREELETEKRKLDITKKMMNIKRLLLNMPTFRHGGEMGCGCPHAAKAKSYEMGGDVRIEHDDYFNRPVMVYPDGRRVPISFEDLLQSLNSVRAKALAAGEMDAVILLDTAIEALKKQMETTDEPPKGSPLGNYDKTSVKNIIENEGLLYAVEYFMDESAISNSEPELKNLWGAARNGLAAFETQMKKHKIEPGLLIHKGKKGFYIISDENGDETPISAYSQATQNLVYNIGDVLKMILDYVGIKHTENYRYEKGGQMMDAAYSYCFGGAIDIQHNELTNSPTLVYPDGSRKTVTYKDLLDQVRKLREEAVVQNDQESVSLLDESIKTLEEQNKLASMKAGGKIKVIDPEVQNRIDRAYELGKKAYLNEKMMVPAQDADLMNLLYKDAEVGDERTMLIMKGWIKGFEYERDQEVRRKFPEMYKNRATGGPVVQEEKLFHVKNKLDRNMEGDMSESMIRANWNDEDEDDTDLTLADFLEDATEGDKWRTGHVTIEMIGFTNG